MDNVFLGLIALGVLVTAAIQVGAIILAIRAARRVEGVLTQLQQDVRPMVANFQAMSADAARATAKIAGQVDRLEVLLADASRKIEDTASAVQQTMVAPVREAMAVVQGIKAAIASVFGGGRAASRGKSPAGAEEEDALFIG